MGVAVETVIEENFAETVLADKTLLSSLKFVSFDDPRTSNLSSLSEPKQSPKWDYDSWRAADLWLRLYLDSSPDTEEKTEQILKTDPETAPLTGQPRIDDAAPPLVINGIKNNWRIFFQIKP